MRLERVQINYSIYIAFIQVYFLLFIACSFRGVDFTSGFKQVELAVTELVIDQLRRICGSASTLTSREDKICYSYDGTPLFYQEPEAILFPETVEQISEILKLANQEKFAVVPRGAGTGLSGGSVPLKDSVVLVMTKWNKIIELDEANLTVTVEPGVVTGDLQKTVEKSGLFYPPDPGSSNVCTIGGNVAENAGGLRGLKYGVTKNYLMGFEMVLPTGEILVSGGKNYKDVAGYNLRDLVVGSEGTLGIFTKILLKLIPVPQRSITITSSFGNLTDCGNSVANIISAHIVPSMIEFLDNTTINCVEDFTHIGLPRNAAAMLILEVDGRGDVVDYEANMIMEILKKNNAEGIRSTSDAEQANTLKTARRSAFSALARKRPTAILEDATVPRSELPVMIEKVRTAAAQNNVVIGNFGHAGDGNLHPTCLIDENDKAEVDSALRAFDFIFNEAIKLGGTITGEHGTGLAKKHFFEKSTPAPALNLMRQIKSAVDPNNILNPGKIFSNSPKCESLKLS